MKHLEIAQTALKQIASCEMKVKGDVMDIARHALPALQAHEAEVLEREAVLVELVGTLVGIKACAKIDGRPEWLTVAEQIDATLNKVKP